MLQVLSDALICEDKILQPFLNGFSSFPYPVLAISLVLELNNMLVLSIHDVSEFSLEEKH